MSEFKAMGGKNINRSFGILISIVFLIVAIYPLIKSEDIRIWALFVAAIFFLIANLVPKILSFPRKIWIKFGLLLGSIVSPIIMVIIYVFTIVPVGLLTRLLGKDLLMQRFDKNINSYWVERSEPMGSMKNQF